MASMSISHSVPINTTIEDAWAKLQLEQTWAGIGPISYVSDATHKADGNLESFEWGADVGGRIYHGTATAIESNRPSRFVLDMDTSEIRGQVSTDLFETGDTCEVTVSIDLTTKGILSAMFFPAIKSALSSGFPKQVEELAAAM